MQPSMTAQNFPSGPRENRRPEVTLAHLSCATVRARSARSLGGPLLASNDGKVKSALRTSETRTEGSMDFAGALGLTQGAPRRNSDLLIALWQSCKTRTD